jgi:alpha/beta superfamily hydrolase
MKPLFFGDARRQLFGAYHEPTQERAARDLGVVIAHPGPHEYNMAHWALRKLAGLLARAGFPTLRFDFYGTGDSAGETGAGSPDEWRQDVVAACQELRESSHVRNIAVVGMRLGATIASLAIERGLEVSELVLWEPVVSGGHFLRELEDVDARQRLLRLYDTRDPSAPELLGYPFAPALRRAIDQLDLCQVQLRPGQRVLLVAGENRPDYRALVESLAARRILVDLTLVRDDVAGVVAAEGNNAMLSQKALIAITDALSLRVDS